MSETKRIKAWWCTNDPSSAGWYAEEIGHDDEVCSCSQHISFPVDLDVFVEGDCESVTEALCEAFPEHEVYVNESR